MNANTSIKKLRDILSGKMSSRMFVLLQLEMKVSTASGFEFLGVNYYRMMVRRIYVCRLIINIDIVLISCGFTLKMIGSATKYESQGIYPNGMINGWQYVYNETT